MADPFKASLRSPEMLKQFYSVPSIVNNDSNKG